MKVADTGLSIQVELLESILAGGGDPIVIDSAALLAAPEATLRTLCGRLGLEFDTGMLSWPNGPKPEDGVWAEHWYSSTHRSTGFAASRPSTEPAPAHLASVVAEARPLYDRLSEFTLDA
ncbi:MAG: hypothetical protein HOM00_05915 [Acidimicrobiaceae bacterium]|nr:hypothetical protein [Acidimicrobiaceae bacterium]